MYLVYLLKGFYLRVFVRVLPLFCIDTTELLVVMTIICDGICSEHANMSAFSLVFFSTSKDEGGI